MALAHGARTLLVLALAGWVGVKIYKGHGPTARTQFDAWAQLSDPGAAQMLQEPPMAGRTERAGRDGG